MKLTERLKRLAIHLFLKDDWTALRQENEILAAQAQKARDTSVQFESLARARSSRIEKLEAQFKEAADQRDNAGEQVATLERRLAKMERAAEIMAGRHAEAERRAARDNHDASRFRALLADIKDAVACANEFDGQDSQQTEDAEHEETP